MLFRSRAPGGVRRGQAPRGPRPAHGRAHLRRPRAHTQGRRRAVALIRSDQAVRSFLILPLRRQIFFFFLFFWFPCPCLELNDDVL